VVSLNFTLANPDHPSSNYLEESNAASLGAFDCPDVCRCRSGRTRLESDKMAAAELAGLIEQLDCAVLRGPADDRAHMARAATELLLANIDRFSEGQVELVDDVLLCLIKRGGQKFLVELSNSLSKLRSPPPKTVCQLAFHPDPAIASPVLKGSDHISGQALAEIASTRGQEHLLAISARATLDETLTSALVMRGNTAVHRAVVKNSGARFSERSLAVLLKIAERNDDLAEMLGRRSDIPSTLLRKFNLVATGTARTKLIGSTSLTAVGQAAASPAESTSRVPLERQDCERAEAELIILNRAGKLNDSTVNRFAVAGEHAKVVAAIALLSQAEIGTINPLVDKQRTDELILACKAARLSWSTTSMILRNRPGRGEISAQELAEGRELFGRVSLSEAQWTIRFGASSPKAR
jgi:uncharacterized protein (DUF2336 family)